MLNQITLQGRLVKEPELRITQSGVSLTLFTLAVNRDFARDETDFIDCTAWRQTADFIGKYFRKGNLMLISGKLQSRHWEDRDGKKRTRLEVIAENAYFCENKAKETEDFAAEYFDEDVPF